VFEVLGVGPSAEPTPNPSRMSRQSDELSESWVQSYLEDVSRR
jgi:LPS sulfotransferase NodH